MITVQRITTVIKMMIIAIGSHSDTVVVAGDDGGPVESEHAHNDRIHNTAVTCVNWLLIVTTSSIM